MAEVVLNLRVQGVDEAQQSVDELVTSLENLQTVADEGIEPNFEEVGEQAEQAANNVDKLSNSLQRKNKVSTQAQAVSRTLTGSFKLATTAFAAFGVQNEEVAQTLLRVQAAAQFSGGIRDLSRGVTALSGSFNILGVAMKAVPFIAIAGAILGILEATGLLKPIIEGLSKIFNDIITPIKSFFGTFKDGKKDVEELETAIKRFNDLIANEARFEFDKRVIQIETEIALLRERGATEQQITLKEIELNKAKNDFLVKDEARIGEERLVIQKKLIKDGLKELILDSEERKKLQEDEKQLTQQLRTTQLEIERNIGNQSLLQAKLNRKKVVEEKKEETKDFEKIIVERFKKEEEFILQNKENEINSFTEQFIEGKISFQTLQAEKVLLEKETNEKLIELRENFRLTDVEKIQVGLETAFKLQDDNQKKILELTSKNLQIEANLKKNFDDDEKKREDESQSQQQKLTEDELVRQKQLQDELAAYKKKKREDELQAQKELQDAIFEFANASISSLTTLSDIYFENQIAKAKGNAKEEEKIARKQFEINKALQLGTAIINGVNSILAITSVPDFTLGVQSAIRIGAQVALNVASIAKIASTKFQLGGGGGGSNTPSLPSLNTSGSIQPTSFEPTTFGSGVSQQQTFGGQPGSGGNVLRAYVSETDLTDTQRRLRNIRNAGEL
jgi:hypothetical protein